MTQEEKDLINEKFLGIHNEIVSGNTLIGQKIDALTERVGKQNGRVQKLEDYREWVAAEVIPKRVTEEKLNCLVEDCHKKIENIETKFEDLNFIMKHPKLFVGALVFLVIITLATFIENNPLKVFQSEPTKTEQVIPK